MRRGVTLIELAIVLGIIAILMGLSVASLQAVRSRASFSGSTTEVVSELKRARMESFSRGTYTAFIIDTTTHQWWGIQTTNAFTLGTFTPASCTAPLCTMISSGRLPTDITFGPTAGYGVALPAPLSGIPTAPAANPRYCSFCAAAGGRGSILFAPGGGAIFSAGPTGVLGQQLTMTQTRDNVTRRKVVAIVERTGLIEAFER